MLQFLRQEFPPLVVLLLATDVANRADEAGDRAVLDDGLAIGMDPADDAIVAPDGAKYGIIGAAARRIEGARDGPQRFRPVVGMQARQKRAAKAHWLLIEDAEGRPAAPIPQQVPARHILVEGADVGCLLGQTQPGFRIQPRLLHPLLLCKSPRPLQSLVDEGKFLLAPGARA